MRNTCTKRLQRTEDNKKRGIGHYVIQLFSSPFLFFMHIYSVIK